MRKHVEQLGMYRVNAIDELLKVVGKLLAAGMVDRTLDIVDHRQQRSDELLGRALALGDTLVGGAATEVLPVGLQTGGALGGVLCLVLGGLLSLCRSIELVAHVGKLFLSLLELELKVVVGASSPARIAASTISSSVIVASLLESSTWFSAASAAGASLASVSSTASTGIFTSFSSESTGAAPAAAAPCELYGRT